LFNKEHQLEKYKLTGRSWVDFIMLYIDSADII